MIEVVLLCCLSRCRDGLDCLVCRFIKGDLGCCCHGCREFRVWGDCRCLGIEGILFYYRLVLHFLGLLADLCCRCSLSLC